jgi:hypothetical protein
MQDRGKVASNTGASPPLPGPRLKLRYMYLCCTSTLATWHERAGPMKWWRRAKARFPLSPEEQQIHMLTNYLVVLGSNYIAPNFGGFVAVISHKSYSPS